MSNSGLTVIKKFYDRWNIQGFVLLSLLIQTILILFAPFRKRTGNVIVVLLSVLAYLVADWVVNVGVGLISLGETEIHEHHGSQKFLDDHRHVDILAFWASFLLLHHLPEQDNAGLWQRQFVGLLSRVFNAITVFSQSLPKNKLSVPTVLLFVAGTIKYGERTYALFCANPKKLRESMLKAPDCPNTGLNNEKMVGEFASMTKANLPTQLELKQKPNKQSKTKRYAVNEGKLDDIQEVQHAYDLFQVFKGLIVEHMFSSRERDESMLFFHQRNPEEAFKVIAIELNFMYEVFYTKAVVAHLMFGHVVVRFISWCAVAAAFSIFYTIDKHDFHKIDVGITYTLFFGAIGLDIIALFMLAFSDWTAASIHKWSGNIIVKGIKRCFLPLLKYFLTLKRINWGTDTESKSRWKRAKQCLELLINPKKCLERARQILFRRWSESLHQYNLIDYCLKENRQKNYVGRIWIKFIDEWLDLKDLYDQMNYIYKKPLAKMLWNFIFEELKNKSNLADDPDTAKKIYSARGDWVLQNTDWIIEDIKLMYYTVGVDYDQSLLLWHIATDLCYNTDRVNNNDNGYREFCKSLSDYMLYLLVMQPTMMSAVSGIGRIRFRDTCAEAKKFFKRKDLGQVPEQEYERACEMIFEVNTDVEPVAVKGDRCKSVLFDACILAKELRKIEGQKRWKLISEVWVELLSYAASHCRANTHVAQLSKGGELITFVWLLVAHFGIGDQFQRKKGNLGVKLIMGK